MTQNTFSALMQQRSEPHDGLDDFPTQPWATKALCELVAKDPSLFGSIYECSLSHLSAYLAFDRLQAGSPSSGISCVTVSRPTRCKKSHGVPAAADAFEVVGVAYHKLYRLIPKILDHVFTFRMLLSEIILWKDKRSSDLCLKGRRGSLWCGVSS